MCDRTSGAAPKSFECSGPSGAARQGAVITFDVREGPRLRMHIAFETAPSHCGHKGWRTKDENDWRNNLKTREDEFADRGSAFGNQVRTSQVGGVDRTKVGVHGGTDQAGIDEICNLVQNSALFFHIGGFVA